MIRQFREFCIVLFVCLVLSLALPLVALAQATATPEPVIAESTDVVPITNIEVNTGGGDVAINPLPVETDAPEPVSTAMPENVQVALVVAVAGVLIVAIIAVAIVQKKSPAQVVQGLPPVFTNTAIPFAWQWAMQRAQRTLDPTDDEYLVKLAVAAGYVVEKLSDGRYVLSRSVGTTATG